MIPSYSEDKKLFSKLREGEMLTASTSDVRNTQFHRRYFALLNLVFFHLPEHIESRLNSLDNLRHEISILIGNTDIYIDQKGESLIRVKSISFKSMGQKKFEEIYSDSVNVILKYYLSEWDEDMIADNLTNFF